MRYGLSFSDLYDRDGLERLDRAFLAFLEQADADLRRTLEAARADPDALPPGRESALLIATGPHLEDFIAELFAIGGEVRALQARHHRLAPLYLCKRRFVQKRAIKGAAAAAAASSDGTELEAALAALLGEPVTELAFARQVLAWEEDEAEHADQLDLAARYAAWAALTPEGRARHADGLLFKLPEKLDPHQATPFVTESQAGHDRYRSPPERLRRRYGFQLTDSGTDLAGALDQANYCIWCHKQGKDSCSKGLKDKATGEWRKNPLGVTLAGCPLEEKISEFHTLKAEGYALATLAVIAIDNPMAAATGHRICNDCMKSCIYQKQQPVNIPEAETRSLRDVLELPWGFEIYSLLTRWNPLSLRRPLPLPASGKRVLIAGMGPAGFTLAHHLMNDGHTVVGIDGLKIEPLPMEISGVDRFGARVPFRPIRDVRELQESLDERVLAGFGGVAEYGITVRWDKNFLKLVRLLLERRSQFALFGGVRFGGTLTADDALAMGFDHIALAIGAGRPTILDLPGGLARGVRTASDFLMALQLTGAAKEDSLANMQVRLPVLVIGGGLTAIDAATESLAYYPRQVEKFQRRYEILAAERGEAELRRDWNDEELEIADEFLAHARAIAAERRAAACEGRPARIRELLDAWGGVTIAYRKRLVDSPSYTLNHEEVEKALEEGIVFAERLDPRRITTDRHGHARALTARVKERDGDGPWRDGPEIELPARTILIAAGTQPNTVLAREDPERFLLDGRYFRACDEAGEPIAVERAIAKPKAVRVLLSKTEDGRAISFFGDLHPSYFGNVVKAMASAKQGYPTVSAMLVRVSPASQLGDTEFLALLNRELRPRVHAVVRLTPNIVEVVVKAPAAARRFSPGQFYRLQNYEADAPLVDGSRLAMEGLALTGAQIDKAQGLVSTIVLEMGGSSNLCALLTPGQPVVLMGPTGAATEMRPDETVVLAGGGLGNAVLFSIGQAMRQAGCRVLYFAGYKRAIDRYKLSEIEAAADIVVWSCDEAPGLAARRPQDKSFLGNIVQSMRAYATGELGAQPIPLAEADRLIVIGSDRMMAAVAGARHAELAPFLRPDHIAIGSINSPMQCMMKEICAQCLQPHIDPATGTRSYVFSCFNQDQGLDCVDFPGLAQRLRQNSVQEKLTACWIDRCLARLEPREAVA